MPSSSCISSKTRTRRSSCSLVRKEDIDRISVTHGVMFCPRSMIGLLTTKLHPHPGDREFTLLGFSAFRSYLKSEINSRKMLPLKSEPPETKKRSPQVAVDARCR